MKVLMLSTDENILREGTEARVRMVEYAGLFEELHVVVLNVKNYQLPITNYQNNGKLFLHSTNSGNKFLALWHAFKMSVSIIGNWKLEIGNCAISAQDPFEVGLIGYLLKKKFKIPLQMQVHTDFLSSYFWRESLKNKIRVLLAKFLLPRAEGIRAVSERTQKFLITNYQLPITKINVLPIFVDIQKIRNAPVKTDLHKKYSQFDFIILMASRLTREKNIGMAIEAMGEVVKNHPKVGLVIVGSGPEEEYQKLNIKNKKLEERVKLESWSEDLASCYKTADLFLLTSNYEGYGRTPIEAVAGGCPVVMTDVGLAGEVIINEKSGMVVPVGDKDALVKAIISLIENKDKRERLVQGAMEKINGLMRKEEYLRKYKELLEKITNDQSPITN